MPYKVQRDSSNKLITASKLPLTNLEQFLSQIYSPLTR